MTEETTPVDPTPAPAPEPVPAATDVAQNSQSASGEANPPVAIPAGTKVAAHGVLSTIESELEKEFAKGQSHFLTWIRGKVNELKLHLKV